MTIDYTREFNSAEARITLETQYKNGDFTGRYDIYREDFKVNGSCDNMYYTGSFITSDVDGETNGETKICKFLEEKLGVICVYSLNGFTPNVQEHN